MICGVGVGVLFSHLSLPILDLPSKRFDIDICVGVLYSWCCIRLTAVVPFVSWPAFWVLSIQSGIIIYRGHHRKFCAHYFDTS